MLIDTPLWDPTSEDGMFRKVLNLAAKQTYKKRSDRFKRLVSYENNLLALYTALDDFHENPFVVTYGGSDRQLCRIWHVLKAQPKNQCSQCLVFFRNPQPLRIHLADINDSNIYCYHFAKPVSHLKINHETPMTALMIDDETYMCNFGCPA